MPETDLTNSPFYYDESLEEQIRYTAQNMANHVGVTYEEAERTIRSALNGLRNQTSRRIEYIEERDYLQEFMNMPRRTPTPITEEQVSNVARDLTERGRVYPTADINAVGLAQVDDVPTDEVIRRGRERLSSFSMSASVATGIVLTTGNRSTCANCGADMPYERSTKKYCTTGCRVAAYKRRIRETPVNVTENAQASQQYVDELLRGHNPAADVVNVNGDVRVGHYHGLPIVTLMEVANLFNRYYTDPALRELMQQWSAVDLINNLFLRRGSMSFNGEAFTWTASRNPEMPVLPSSSPSEDTPEPVVLQHGVQSGSVATTPRRGRPSRASQRSPEHIDVAPAEQHGPVSEVSGTGFSRSNIRPSGGTVQQGVHDDRSDAVSSTIRGSTRTGNTPSRRHLT